MGDALVPDKRLAVFEAVVHALAVYLPKRDRVTKIRGENFAAKSRVRLSGLEAC